MNYTKHQISAKLTKESDPDDADMHGTSEQPIGDEKNLNREGIYPDYPSYPAEEDIYSNYSEEQELDPEQPSRLKGPVVLSNLINQLDFGKELSADELDVPGTELDDEQERIGSEDEENNYYSLGGDSHDDLEETKEEGV